MPYLYPSIWTIYDLHNLRLQCVRGFFVTIDMFTLYVLQNVLYLYNFYMFTQYIFVF